MKSSENGLAHLASDLLEHAGNGMVKTETGYSPRERTPAEMRSFEESRVRVRQEDREQGEH